ncbi:MAG TPA: hypothetical protein VH092_35070, partial [Urbifossiella sp.]|nr:hypothetical protein [Urbifossiella sp.]
MLGVEGLEAREVPAVLFACNNGTTGAAYLSGDQVYLYASNGPGWDVPEGHGASQLVQATDGRGRPAAAWVQNGELWVYNQYTTNPWGGPQIRAAGVSAVAAFAANNATTGLAYQTAGGVVYLSASNGPGWDVPEGGGASQLVQATDGIGRPAAAWVQNGALWVYNQYTVNSSGGPQTVLTGGPVADLVNYPSNRGGSDLAFRRADGNLYLWGADGTPTGHLVWEGGAAALAQGADPSGQPVAVWWQNGQVWLYSGTHGTTNPAGVPGFGPAAFPGQSSQDGSAYAVDQVGELWRYAPAGGLTRLGGQFAAVQAAADGTGYALDTAGELYAYRPGWPNPAWFAQGVTGFQVTPDGGVLALTGTGELAGFAPGGGGKTVLDMGVQQFKPVGGGVLDLHGDGSARVVRPDGSGGAPAIQAAFADLDGSTGHAILTPDGQLYLVAPNGPAWAVPEGNGTTQLVQATDQNGRPAAAWVQDGGLYRYNQFGVTPAGGVPQLASGVSGVAAFADSDGTTGLAYLTKTGTVYLSALNGPGWDVPEGSGATALGQGTDADGRPVAVWWQGG